MLNAISNNLNSYKPNLDNKNIRNVNLDTTLPLNTTSSQNLAKPKSEAVSEILGYSVDKEGYFTADFNEAAGLPKDFKIYAKDIENLLDSFSSSDLKAFSSVDIAQSLKNIYKLFTQIAPKNNAPFYKKDDLASFPVAFIYDEKSLNFIKGYGFEEWQGMGDYTAPKGTKLVILMKQIQMIYLAIQV